MLYHYCGFDKFKSIIESKTLWLTQFVKSNDIEEINRTLKIIWNNIKCEVARGIEDLPNSADIIATLDKQIELDLLLSTEGDETPYGVCLSENRDLAQNWNEYGDMSKGVALGFSNDLFVGIRHDMPHPSVNLNNALGWNQVFYDENNLSEQFIPLFVEVLRNSPSALGWLTVRTTLKHYSAFIKNPTFRDEKEVRIVFYPYKGIEMKSSSEISGLIEKPIPHCSLPWIKSNGVCGLKEIIIGTNCKYNEKDIEKLLVKNNIHSDIAIVRSEYPYRISANR